MARSFSTRSAKYSAHRKYLFALWDALDLGNRVVLVLDDWGATLGFDWANQHRDRVRGIVHMEGVVVPLNWSDVFEQYRPFFRALRSPDGERMVLEDNIFIEERLPGAVLRQLTDEEMNHYREPFRKPGEDRRPTLSWPRNLPIEGEPAEVIKMMNEYSNWLAHTDVPKLFINGEPGAIATGRIREVIRSWPHQTEVTVKGRKLFEGGRYRAGRPPSAAAVRQDELPGPRPGWLHPGVRHALGIERRDRHGRSEITKRRPRGHELTGA